MKLRELRKLVASTADAAFIVDARGTIVAWNKAAEELIGTDAPTAMGSLCGPLIQGRDECGPVCSEDCMVQQACRRRHSMRNFDLQIRTKEGPRWCNVSVLIAEEPGDPGTYAIHVIRPIDVRKRLEMLVRDFIVNGTGLPPEKVTELVKSSRSPAQVSDLTRRELTVLSRLSRGETTARIAAELHISRTTVNNHVQHILRKLDAHSRLEAIRRAERAGLI
jgi:PAS domain S-box-containing protein